MDSFLPKISAIGSCDCSLLLLELADDDHACKVNNKSIKLLGGNKRSVLHLGELAVVSRDVPTEVSAERGERIKLTQQAFFYSKPGLKACKAIVLLARMA